MMFLNIFDELDDVLDLKLRPTSANKNFETAPVWPLTVADARHNTPRFSVSRNSNGNRYEIEIEAPGFSKGDFDITIKNNILDIIAAKKSVAKTNFEDSYSERNDAQKSKLITSTRRYLPSFRQKFSIDPSTELDSINLENGILTIALVQQSEQKQDYQVPIGYKRETQREILAESGDKKLNFRRPVLD